MSYIRKICSIGILLLVFNAVSVMVAEAQNGSPTSPGLSLVWSTNVGGLRSFSLSPHARRLALLTTEGKLALWIAQEGVPVWASAKQTSTNVLVSDGAGMVLTYNSRSLLSTSATLRAADTGDVIWSRNFGAAIWCAAFDDDGKYAAIGTGDKSFYLYNLLGGISEKEVPLAGTPVSTAFAQNGNSVLVGQWDRSGLSCLDLAGSTMWRASGEMDRKYLISNVGPRFVTYVGSSNRHGRSPIVYVVRESTGQLLWAYDLGSDSYEASAQTNDMAGMTGITCAKQRKLRSGSVTERRLNVVDRFGQVSWQKGGLFWAPILICLTPDQMGLIVYDGNRTLYRLDSQGRTVAHAFLSDVLKDWSVSIDDSTLVVYTHDGQLSLLHIQ